MPYCQKCGTKIGEDDRFCSECGAALTEYRPTREEWRGPRDECFGEKGERDHIGLISLGFAILIIGYIWYTHPGIFSDIRDLFVRLGEERVFKPSTMLINAFAVFLSLCGVSNFVVAGIRVAVRQPFRRPLGDILSGIFLILFSYFVSLYSQGLLIWQTVIFLLLLFGALLIIIYATIRYAIEKIYT